MKNWMILWIGVLFSISWIVIFGLFRPLSIPSLILVPFNSTAVIVPVIDVMSGVPQVIFIGITTMGPSDVSESQGRSSNIFVTFDESMDPATVNNETFIVKGTDNITINGVFTSDASKKVWIFNPTDKLAPDSLYTIIITKGAKGVSGNSLIEDFVWSFTTIPSASEGPSPSASAPPSAPAILTAIILSPASANIGVGSSQQLNVAKFDQYGSHINAAITYTSSNTSVATVNSTGAVTAIALGNATITAASGAISVASTINVIIMPPILTTIMLSPSFLNLTTDGFSYQLTVSSLNQFGSSINATINYTTSNSSVAVVNASGAVIGVGAGIAAITASSGAISNSSIISVTKYINPNSTTLNWTDYGPIFGLGSQKAYYPSVLKINGVYHMWYGAGDIGNLGYANSTDGVAWTKYGEVNGSGTIVFYHSKVLFDNNGFGNATGHKYKIWYWNYPVSVYSLAINYAESDDGINWVNIQPITQDAVNFLVYPASTGTGCGNPFCGTYGPEEVIYNPLASNSGTNPFSYSFAMYYDAYQGTPTQENTALAYSIDGKHWIRYGSAPVINAAGTGSGEWDAQYVTVSSVVPFGNSYNLWYGGGISTNSEGIGYAISCDGINWIKVNENPLFTTADGTLYRNDRAYTPFVFEDNGIYKMWYSCKGNAVAYGGDSSDYAICYATADADPLIPLCI